jgi:uncharacterized protein
VKLWRAIRSSGANPCVRIFEPKPSVQGEYSLILNGIKMIKIAGCLLLFLIMLGLYTIIEPYWLQDKLYVIVSQDIPEKFHNTKIVFLSDIHHGPYFSISRVKNLVDRVNAEKPDIVLLGGDYVYRGPKYITPCFEELKRLKAPLGIYGVLGNHDHWEDPDLTKKRMAESGIILADNKGFWVAKGAEKIKIGGVGDYYEDAQDIGPTIDDAKKNDFVILLSHNPDYAESIGPDRIDLIVSGHTHGGQVTLFGLWAPLLPSNHGQKYRTGLIDCGKYKLIVSNGIGTIKPPIRFFARPQIVTVILKRKPD